MIHRGVLIRETVESLDVSPEGVYVDATVGAGGHAAAIAERVKTGLVIGLDCDVVALKEASERLKKYDQRVKLVHANFRELALILDRMTIPAIDGALFDLGVSSLQLDTAERGFSFRLDASLDMRMDQRFKMTAADVVNTYPRDELESIIRTYGEERWAGEIATAIVNYRAKKRLNTTLELAQLIESILSKKRYGRQKIHRATRTFQALRIHVNDELSALKEGLTHAWMALKPEGCLAVISFHSLEDRIVKEFFRERAAKCVCPPGLPICMCHKIPESKVYGPYTPTESEIRSNPRSRSAKLRVARKFAKRQ
jgi:16S rRNA (cytosine1402-N4)-methyltransferase